MPTYLYKCVNENCVGEFEEYHSIVTKLEECPHCQEAGRGVQGVERLISGGSGKGIVTQTAEEFTASLPSEVGKIHRRATADTNFLANLVGEKKFSDRNPRGY